MFQRLNVEHQISKHMDQPLKKFFKILNILECHKLIERLVKWNDLGAEVAEDRSLGLVCKNSKSNQIFYHFSSFKSTVLFWDYKIIEQVVKGIMWVICWMKVTSILGLVDELKIRWVTHPPMGRQVFRWRTSLKKSFFGPRPDLVVLASSLDSADSSWSLFFLSLGPTSEKNVVGAAVLDGWLIQCFNLNCPFPVLYLFPIRLEALPSRCIGTRT